MERLSRPNSFKNIEADNDQSTAKMRLSATAGYDEPGQALPFDHEIPRAYSPGTGYSGTGAPGEFRVSSPSSSLTRSLQSTRSLGGTLGAATGVAYEGALAEPEPVLDGSALESMVDNYEDLIQWAEGLEVYNENTGNSETGVPCESSPSSNPTRSLRSASRAGEQALDETALEWMVDNHDDLAQWAEGLKGTKSSSGFEKSHSRRP
ncbi:hypothetical protein FOZ61_005083 [Perkinsus olseni]|uniref:Uncharacterized protein n=1 Tax=Perkinsus olseni TaxID=32597 RepID=A0A7J6M1K1_PEROL|nr:hypothetical protein FOZ61_005083 [Perkinsus olseni]KAF4665070.1 hypothetical protein FOL46_003895 [Perkinsus olseni]